eukprot:297846-Chlamydomonas_euryale.AAC.18
MSSAFEAAHVTATVCCERLKPRQHKVALWIMEQRGAWMHPGQEVCCAACHVNWAGHAERMGVLPDACSHAAHRQLGSFRSGSEPLYTSARPPKNEKSWPMPDDERGREHHPQHSAEAADGSARCRGAHALGRHASVRARHPSRRQQPGRCAAAARAGWLARCDAPVAAASGLSAKTPLWCCRLHDAIGNSSCSRLPAARQMRRTSCDTAASTARRAPGARCRRSRVCRLCERRGQGVLQFRRTCCFSVPRRPRAVADLEARCAWQRLMRKLRCCVRNPRCDAPARWQCVALWGRADRPRAALRIYAFAAMPLCMERRRALQTVRSYKCGRGFGVGSLS